MNHKGGTKGHKEAMDETQGGNEGGTRGQWMNHKEGYEGGTRGQWMNHKGGTKGAQGGNG